MLALCEHFVGYAMLSTAAVFFLNLMFNAMRFLYLMGVVCVWIQCVGDMNVYLSSPYGRAVQTKWNKCVSKHKETKLTIDQKSKFNLKMHIVLFVG